MVIRIKGNRNIKNWVASKTEGIKPGKPGKILGKGCPNCDSNNVLPTGKTIMKGSLKGNRTYKCLDCKADFASPTTYAECEKFGLIGKDLVIHDCIACLIPEKEGFDVVKLAKEGKKCPYFKGFKKIWEE